jgi:protoheme IX farnesyltransferase
VAKRHIAGLAFGRYLELTRPRIVMMILVACTIGLLLGGGRHVGWALALWTMLGTALVTGGSCALNSFMDRDADALMERTRRRPLPSGAIRPAHALIFGLAIVAAGCVVLLWKANALAAGLGLAGVLVYVLIYTPLKRVTWANTSIGAVSGAIPPLIGWAAATDRIGPGGWILFGMLFAWQHAHFWTIAWLLRDDYRRAGFQMLPVVYPGGDLTFRFTLFASAALIPLSLLLVGLGLAGPAYCCGAVVVGGLILAAGIQFLRRQSRHAARMLMFACAAYLPVLLAMIVVDRH